MINLDISQVDPVGFNAKYFKITQKDYKVSRGKSRLFRRALILIFTGMIVSILSIKFLPDQFEGNFSWLSPLLWFPRLAAVLFIYLAYVRIKEMQIIKEFLFFTTEGIKYEDKLFVWQEIMDIKVQYYLTNDDKFDLIIFTAEETIVIDITKVDEFSEDVASVLSKYYKKYKD